MSITALKEHLKELDYELGEIGEIIQKALDREFKETYEVGDVRITRANRISVLIEFVKDEDED